MSNPLAKDLDHVMHHTQGLWEELRGQRIFITGGTGFFGCWLLESFAWANDTLKLDAHAVVLSRNPQALAAKAPHLLNHPAISFVTGDIRDFEFPAGNFSHVIHAATEASAKLNAEQPLLMLETIVDGTQRALEFARHAGAKKFLLTSSGAVYGPQPKDLTHVPESYTGAPDTMNALSAYGEGKRLSEHLSVLHGRQYGFEVKVARCFAFVGPYLPLDSHYAIGNFLRNALAGEKIHILGDGTPMRSYLYAADLAIWLWTILFRGEAFQAYNVGAENDLSIGELARKIQNQFSPGSPVVIAGQPRAGSLPERYVPATGKARSQLHLNAETSLDDALQRTVAWIKRN
ncbi:MAG TPA: NAD-dependent epimerase/dehydratase family protein [Verrucomicrobiae bacterium]